MSEMSKSRGGSYPDEPGGLLASVRRAHELHRPEDGPRPDLTIAQEHAHVDAAMSEVRLAFETFLYHAVSQLDEALALDVGRHEVKQAQEARESIQAIINASMQLRGVA